MFCNGRSRDCVDLPAADFFVGLYVKGCAGNVMQLLKVNITADCGHNQS